RSAGSVTPSFAARRKSPSKKGGKSYGCQTKATLGPGPPSRRMPPAGRRPLAASVRRRPFLGAGPCVRRCLRPGGRGLRRRHLLDRLFVELPFHVVELPRAGRGEPPFLRRHDHVRKGGEGPFGVVRGGPGRVIGMRMIA